MTAHRLDLVSRPAARVARTLALSLVTAVAALSGAALAGGPKAVAPSAKAPPSPPRRVLDPASFVKLDAAVAAKLGTHVVGVVHFPPLAEGTPLGSATEACGALTVKAYHRASLREPHRGPIVVGGPPPIVDDAKVAATPVDAADVAKGCRFQVANLPKGKDVVVEVAFDQARGWAPACGGDAATWIEGGAVVVRTPEVDAVAASATLEIHRKCVTSGR